MEKRESISKEKERDLDFFLHILTEIADYAKKNGMNANDTVIEIAKFILWMFQREEGHETGSTRDKHQGADPELDQ